MTARLQKGDGTYKERIRPHISHDTAAYGVSESDFFVESQNCAVRAIAAATASAPSFAGRLCLSLEPRIVEKDAETAELSPATCLQQLASLTVVDLQKKASFFGGPKCVPGGPPPEGGGGSISQF